MTSSPGVLRSGTGGRSRAGKPGQVTGGPGGPGLALPLDFPKCQEMLLQAAGEPGARAPRPPPGEPLRPHPGPEVETSHCRASCRDELQDWPGPLSSDGGLCPLGCCPHPPAPKGPLTLLKPSSAKRYAVPSPDRTSRPPALAGRLQQHGPKASVSPSGCSWGGILPKRSVCTPSPRPEAREPPLPHLWLAERENWTPGRKPHPGFRSPLIAGGSPDCPLGGPGARAASCCLGAEWKRRPAELAERQSGLDTRPLGWRSWASAWLPTGLLTSAAES